MMIKEAIVARFQDLCRKENIKYNELVVRAGVTPSIIYSMMDENHKDLSVLTVKKLCDDLDISVIDFFNDDLFKDLEQEIK